jgi:hypothetical protein
MLRGDLIIQGSKVKKVPTGTPGLYTIRATCSCCGARIKEEIWAQESRSSQWIMTSPKEYVRVILGVHPEVVSAQKGVVPAVYTLVYFCKACEEKFRIVYHLLLLLVKNNLYPCKWPCEFDPLLGCYITIWTLCTLSQPRWPLDYQMNLETMKDITEQLMKMSVNPFRVGVVCES